MDAYSLSGVTLSRAAFHRFLRLVRPDLVPGHVDVIFNAMDLTRAGRIEIREWIRLCDFIDVSFELTEDAPLHHQHGLTRLRARLSRFFLSPAYEYMTDLLVLVNAATIIFQLDTARARNGTLTDLNRVFLYLFTVELCLKALCLGPRRFWSPLINKLDTGVVTAALVLVVTSAYNLTNQLLVDIVLFRIVRIVRLLLASARLRGIIVTVRRLYPALRSLAVILFSVYYFFALLGMFLFGGLIRPGKMSPAFMDTYYAKNNYWENNFDDFPHALVTLFEIMIVNNWNLNVEAFVVASRSNWPRVYFVAYFFCAVVVCMNVVVALVLEAFITRYNTCKEGARQSVADLDGQDRRALTTALKEYAEEHETSVYDAEGPDSPASGLAGFAGDGGAGAGAGAQEEDDDSEDSGGEGEALPGGAVQTQLHNRAKKRQLRRLWRVVLKARTQRNYKMIFDTDKSHISDH